MENEYAQFGLPGDPANKPVEPSQAATVHHPGFLRHLWWMLPAAALVLVLPCGCCGGLFVWLIGSIKSSEPYQMALHRVETAPEVIDQLGEPIAEAGWMPTGNYSYRSNNGMASGEANFDFSVRGPKGTAHVHAEARCRNGTWAFQVIDVTPANIGRAIALQMDEKPGKVVDEDAAARK